MPKEWQQLQQPLCNDTYLKDFVLQQTKSSSLTHGQNPEKYSECLAGLER